MSAAMIGQPGRLERVTTIDHAGVRRTRDLEVVIDRPPGFLCAWEVDDNGARRHRYHVIDRTAIVERVRLREDLHYGGLVADDR